MVVREQVGRGGIHECCEYVLFSGKGLGRGGGEVLVIYFLERREIGFVSFFFVNFRLSVVPEEEEKESALFLLLCSWGDYEFLCLFLE